MAVARPTFHESWYRIAELKPRLLSAVKVYRQHFRGKLWYVIENPLNNEFFRVSSEAYQFVGLLDGKRTVSQAWHICNEQAADMAPTQGEVIHLLGQLYTMNLLYADLPPDSQSLLNRYKMRVKRRIKYLLTNILFIRIPLIDPNRFLDRWVGIVGKVYTLPAFIIWLIVVLTGLYFVISNFDEFGYQSTDVLAPGNLIWLYLSMVFAKIFHEFSHAFACKKFGKLTGGGGQVHNLGVMFLVFLPLPYVDASSSWAFRNKWHRAVVGMAGVAAELFIAAIAAVFWANTSTGTIHIIAYNIIFIASVSTLIFNGNPLLRYDAYYVLSDLIEIPNLGQRSVGYIFYIVKKYAWKIKNVPNPSNSAGESIWFVFYGIASTIYRIYISIRILLFMSRRLPEQFFIIVPIMAASAIFMWGLMPVGRFLKYLFTGPELSRTRSRALATTVVFVSMLTVLLGLLPWPYNFRVEGVVEPANIAMIHVQTDGFVRSFLKAPAEVSPEGSPLITGVNYKLQAQKDSITAERKALEAKWRIAQTQEMAAAQVYKEQIEALDEKIARIDEELSNLNLHSPIKGIWVSADIEKTKGMYLMRGHRIGLVADINDINIRAVAGQAVAAQLIEQPYKRLEIRAKGRPQQTIEGTIEQIMPAGLEDLPSDALGYAVGGVIPTKIKDAKEIKAAEHVFEIRIKPKENQTMRLLTGQRVIARIQLPSKPLGVQWAISLRQLFQRRFNI